jgi:site-specific DNA-methyltransferase (adenine-specific)
MPHNKQMENQVIQGDCLEVMKDIPDKSIDMILCDLPYGTTACKWDTIIPFEPLWEQYKRIIKDNGAIVLTASQPFTSALVMSNPKMFKYEWIWDKAKGSNPLLSKKQPMKSHENILVFSKSQTIYNPQMTDGKPYLIPKTGGNRTNSITNAKDSKDFQQKTDPTKRFPLTIQKYSIHCGSKIHPTQKPVDLFEYLIKTYTNEGDLVLDNAAGSGTTGVACRNTNRNYILIEKEPEYIEIINKRLNN